MTEFEVKAEQLKKEFDDRIEALKKEFSLADKTATYKAGDYIVAECSVSPDVVRRLKSCRINGDYLHWAEDVDSYECRQWALNRIRPATKEEIQSALQVEGKKKGFKQGVRVARKGFDPSFDDDKTIGISTNGWTYHEYEDMLCCGDTAVYCKGIWATILKEPEIKVAGYSCEYKGDKVKIGCKTFGRQHIGWLIACMNDMNIEAVIIEGHTGTRKEFQAVNDNWK